MSAAKKHHQHRQQPAAPRALSTLEIPDALPIPWDDATSTLYGVGLNAIANGLKVFVEAYQDMASGDRVEVFWDSSGAAFGTVVVDSSNVNQRLEFTLPKERFIEGDFAGIFYRIWRVSGQNADAPTRTVRVQLSTPGGADPDPSTPHNEDLAAPQVPEDILLLGVDAEQAESGVDVTIPVYENSREYDRIDFSWGGETLLHTVQPGEEGQVIVLHVDKAMILAAGNGQLQLQYQVIDAAGNFSDGWSMITPIDVLVGDTVLDPPIVADAIDGILSLADLDGQAALVEVLAVRDHFDVDDSVELTWKGRTADGAEVDWSDSQSVISQTQIIEFQVPYASVAAIAMGQAVVSYVLHKGTGVDLMSIRAQVQVIGALQALPAPTVREAQDGSLAGDVAQATVDIAAYPGMAAGDLVTLHWDGLTAGGEPLTYSDEKTVSGSGAGKTVTFTVSGPEQVAPLDGGSLTISYSVAGANGSNDSEGLQLSVGSAAPALPAPSVQEAENNVLASDVLQATVEIEPYPGMAAEDRVDLFWQGNVSGEFTDWIPVSSATVGHALTFTVYPESIEPNSSAEVSYSVTYAAGGVEDSAVLHLGIGEALALPGPTIDQAVGDQLDPADVPNGATVRIDVSANLQAGDLVTLHWVGSSDAGTEHFNHTVSASQVGKDLTIVASLALVVANAGNSIELSYDLARAAGGYETSPVSVYEVLSESTLLPAPTLDQAEGDQLNPAALFDGATARIDASAQLQAGDVVTLHWLGQPGAGSYDGQQTVSAEQAGKAMTFSVPLAVAIANIGHDITLDYDVLRSGSTEASAQSVYQVLAQTLALPTPVIDEAQGDLLDPADVPDGATVRILASANLESADTLYLHWVGLPEGGIYNEVHSVSAGEVGNDITLVVPHAVVLANLDTTIELYYSVVRGVESGLSPVASFQIQTLATLLPAPTLDEAEGDQLNPAALLDGATARIDASAQLQAGDVVTLHWLGQPGTGSYEDQQTVSADQAGKAMTFSVPLAVAIANIGHDITLGYDVLRSGSTEASAQSVYQVLAQTLVLPTPVIDEAQGNLLDPADALDGATVRILASANLESADTLYLHWVGLPGAGTHNQVHTVAAGEVGNDITLVVPHAVVLANLDTTIELFYSLVRGVESGLSPVASFQIQTLAALLPAPIIVEAQGDVLNPAFLFEGATARIDATAQLQANDLVTLYWVGLPGLGSYQHRHIVASNQAGTTLDLLVPLSVAAANVGHDITLSYDVFRAGSTEVSAESVYQIQTQLLVVPTPVIDEAQGNQLDPADVPDGATVRILASANLESTDTLYLHWEGLPGGGTSNQIHTVTSGEVGNDITFVVPYAVVAANQDTTINLFYSVMRGFETGMSPVASFDIGTGSIELPAPTIDEALGDELDPADVPDGATVRIDASAVLKAGDLVTVHWEGVPDTGSADIDHTVMSGEAGQDLTATVPRSVVEANEGNSIELSYDITRAGGGFDTSPAAAYRIIDQGDGHWETSESMLTPRAAHLLHLLDNGSIVAVNGREASGVTSTICEVYAPGIGTWKFTPAFRIDDFEGSAIGSVTVSNGKLLTIGLFDFDVIPYASLNLYDPPSNTWIDLTTDEMKLPFGYGEEISRLGEDTALRDIAQFSYIVSVSKVTPGPTPEYTNKVFYSCAQLANELVLISGGRYFEGEVYSTCQTFNGSKFEKVSNMLSPRYSHKSITLTNGKALIIGGFTDESATSATPSCEIYDATADRWTLTGSLNITRSEFTATRLDNGFVLVTGGKSFGPEGLSAESSIEIYDPETEEWTLFRNMLVKRRSHAAVKMSDGSILVTGGFDENGVKLSSAERFFY